MLELTAQLGREMVKTALKLGIVILSESAANAGTRSLHRSTKIVETRTFAVRSGLWILPALDMSIHL